MGALEPTHLQIEQLVDEVISELKKKLGHIGDMNTGDVNTGNMAAGDMKTGNMNTGGIKTGGILVLGALTTEEDRVLRRMYQPVFSAEEGDYGDVLVTQLSANCMAQIALGMAGDSSSACILQSLMEGRRVFILKNGLEYRKYRDTAFKTLYQLYQGYEDVIRKFGGEIVSDIQYIVDKENRGSFTAEENMSSTEGTHNMSELRLLRESDLAKIRGDGYGTVVIGENTIITPLAQDYLTNHNLSVRRQ